MDDDVACFCVVEKMRVCPHQKTGDVAKERRQGEDEIQKRM